MLDGLDAVGWARLTHAYGAAGDVPALLRAVAGDDAAARDRALFELYGTIWHQGTVYAATAPAVPFLLELAVRPSAPDRDRVVVLLGLVARGQSYHAVHAPSRREEAARELAWVAAAHAAVRAGAAVLLGLLGDGERPVRAAAAYALACLPEEAARSRPALRAASEAASDPGERLAAGLALAVLGELWPAAFEPAAPTSLPVERLHRLAAATAGGAFPPEDTLELVLDLATDAFDPDRLDDDGAP